jgi:hypothetical protein
MWALVSYSLDSCGPVIFGHPCLIAGQQPNKYGGRSVAIGKRFGKLKTTNA